MKLIYGQYDEKNYPLKRYYANEIPPKIMKCIWKLSNTKNVIVRGGLAFIFLFNKNDYKLKDMDMLSFIDDEKVFIKILDEAEVIYINKNSFNEKVITAFWKSKNEYFKLDILMNQKINKIEKCNWNNKEYFTIDVSFLWMNRMCKIAEKIQRKHNDQITINHYEIVKYMCENILNCDIKINSLDIAIVNLKIEAVENILNKIIGSEKTREFIELNQKIINR